MKFSLKKWVTFFGWLFLGFVSSAVADEFIVTELLSDQTVRVRKTHVLEPRSEPNALGIFISSQDEEPLGYAVLEARIPTGDVQHDWVARVTSVSGAKVIRVGTVFKLIDLNERALALPPRFDLIHMKRRQVANRYKPQVYLGHYAGGQTAATLYNSEKIAGPWLFGYGLNDRFQIDTIPANYIIGEPNFALKWNGFDDGENRISLHARYNYSLRAEKTYGSLAVLWDSAGASRFIGYTQLRILTRQPSQVVANGEISDQRFTAELQTFQGFLTSDWNRIVAGPKFNIENKSIGGTIAFYMLGKKFDWMIGVRSENFVNDDLSAKGFLPFADFWWRF